MRNLKRKPSKAEGIVEEDEEKGKKTPHKELLPPLCFAFLFDCFISWAPKGWLKTEDLVS